MSEISPIIAEYNKSDPKYNENGNLDFNMDYNIYIEEFKLHVNLIPADDEYKNYVFGYHLFKNDSFEKVYGSWTSKTNIFFELKEFGEYNVKISIKHKDAANDKRYVFFSKKVKFMMESSVVNHIKELKNFFTKIS